MPSKTIPHKTKDFGHGVTREVIHVDNEVIVVYRIQDDTREAWDAYYEAAKESTEWLPKDRTLRTIHHVDNLGAMVSPYASSIIQKILEISSDYDGYSAILTQKSLASRMLELMIRQAARIVPNWNMRIFHDRGEAVSWLMAQENIQFSQSESS